MPLLGLLSNYTVHHPPGILHLPIIQYVNPLRFTAEHPSPVFGFYHTRSVVEFSPHARRAGTLGCHALMQSATFETAFVSTNK